MGEGVGVREGVVGVGGGVSRSAEPPSPPIFSKKTQPSSPR